MKGLRNVFLFLATLMAVLMFCSIGGFVIQKIVWWRAAVGIVVSVIVGVLAIALAHDAAMDAEKAGHRHGP